MRAVIMSLCNPALSAVSFRRLCKTSHNHKSDIGCLLWVFIHFLCWKELMLLAWLLAVHWQSHDTFVVSALLFLSANRRCKRLNVNPQKHPKRTAAIEAVSSCWYKNTAAAWKVLVFLVHSPPPPWCMGLLIRGLIGANPPTVKFVTSLGWKRQTEISLKTFHFKFIQTQNGIWHSESS